MGLGFVTDRWVNILFIAVFTVFLVIPVAYLSANPDFIVQWSGELMADYCIRNGVCDFQQLKAGLGVSLFVMITLFIAFLEAVKPESSVDDTLDEIEGMVEQLSSWYEFDHPEEERDTEKASPVIDGKQDFRVKMAFVVPLIVIVITFLISYAFGIVENRVGDVVASVVASVGIGFMFYILVFTFFFKDREMFWERNKYIRKLYHELEADREADQA